MTYLVIRLQPAELDRVLLALENDSSDEALEIRESIEAQKPAPEAPDFSNPPALFEVES